MLGWKKAELHVKEDVVNLAALCGTDAAFLKTDDSFVAMVR
jgi:hypothetical protein